MRRSLSRWAFVCSPFPGSGYSTYLPEPSTILDDLVAGVVADGTEWQVKIQRQRPIDATDIAFAQPVCIGIGAECFDEAVGSRVGGVACLFLSSRRIRSRFDPFTVV